ncbi:MAG: response regulator transcription factor [Planctomycetota bacterium]|nr:response regulator transcription factor [Planctomycetota bacterium]
MARRRILVVEDDAAIRRGVVDALESEGYQAIEAARGDTAVKIAKDATFDLMLLDLILPGLRGLQVLEQVRADCPGVPIIVLTARGEESDRVAGLRLGADDYVVKPFSVQELLARIAAVLRRSAERSGGASKITLPGAVVDFDRRQVRFDDGGQVDLSEREANTLRYLAEHAGRAISRDELITHVWQLDPKGLQTRAIDMQIARLREKLRDDSSNPKLIRTIRGKGYLFMPTTADDQQA